MIYIYNILIAENDYIINRILSNRNHLVDKIFFVQNLLDTIHIIKNNRIHVAILDLDMPCAQAYEILRCLEINTKTVTEIILFNSQCNNHFLKQKKYKILHKPLNVYEVKNLIIDTCQLLEDRYKLNIAN